MIFYKAISGVAILLLICIGMSYTPKNDVQYLRYRSDSIALDIDRKIFKDLESGHSVIYCQDSMQSTPLLVQLALNSHNIYFFDLKGKFVKKQHISGLHTGPMWNFFMNHSNEYFFSHDDGKISASDSVRCKKIYSIDYSLQQSNYCYSLSPTSDFQVNADSTLIMLLVNRNCDPNLSDFSSCHFSTPCLGNFTLKKDSIRLKAPLGYYPENFKEGYSYDHSCIHAINKNTIVYGFADSDSIFSVNTNGGPRKAISINDLGVAFKPKKFVKDSMNHIDYVERHFVESPCVSAIKYDKWNNVYYIGIQDGINFYQDGIRVNTVSDASSRIIVLDEDLKMLNVIQFPAGRFKRLSQIIVTNSGVLIQLNNRKNISYEKYNFFQFGNHTSLRM